MISSYQYEAVYVYSLSVIFVHKANINSWKATLLESMYRAMYKQMEEVLN